MNTFLKKIALLIGILLVASCGDKNTQEPDDPTPSPSTPESPFPDVLVGEWHFYSGNPVSFLSDYQENNIYNQILTFTTTGNLSEELLVPKDPWNQDVKEEKYYGNWSVNNNKINLNTFDGDPININVSYSIVGDALHITSNGKTSVFYKKEKLVSLRGEALLRIWYNSVNGREPSQKIRFESDGVGYIDKTIIDNMWSSYHFNWNLSGDILSIKYDSDVRTYKYTFGVLSKRCLILKSDDSFASLRNRCFLSFF